MAASGLNPLQLCKTPNLSSSSVQLSHLIRRFIMIPVDIISNNNACIVNITSNADTKSR